MALERPKSLRELALETLRSSIVNGSLKMGQTLSERGISEELGVSKSPVREALAQLRDEGLVTIEPQKGARVFTLSDSEVAQICDFRQAIETAAFELALKRNPTGLVSDMKSVVDEMRVTRVGKNEKRYLQLDTDFHHLIFVHAENHYLTASYSRYEGKIAALRTHLAKLPKHTDLSFEEHVSLLAAVQDGDMDVIRTLLGQHIDRTRQAYESAAIMLEASIVA